MYYQDKTEAKELLDGLQDALDDMLTFDAKHDDQFNSELVIIQNILNDIKETLKTL